MNRAAVPIHQPKAALPAARLSSRSVVPPVYRPNAAQSKAVSAQADMLPTAPPAYRPQTKVANRPPHSIAQARPFPGHKAVHPIAPRGGRERDRSIGANPGSQLQGAVHTAGSSPAVTRLPISSSRAAGPLSTFAYQSAAQPTRPAFASSCAIQRAKTSESGSRALTDPRVGKNLQIIAQAFPKLPPNAQKFLKGLIERYGKDERVVSEWLTRDPHVFKNILVGLALTPVDQQLSLDPNKALSFLTRLSTLDYGSVLSGEGMPSPTTVMSNQRALTIRRPFGEGPRYEFPNQDEQSRMINYLIGHTEPARRKKIPKNIHRFWTGGPLSEGAFKTLMKTANESTDMGWTNYLWYSETLENELEGTLHVDKRILRKDQREGLKLMGYQVRAIESLGMVPPTTFSGFNSWFNKNIPGRNLGSPVSKADLETFAMKAANSAKGGQWDNTKYFSDLARLLYLHELGGFHMDVDVGMGKMDLATTYYHRDPEGHVPLLGSLLRTSEDTEPIAHIVALNQLRRLPYLTDETVGLYNTHAKALVDRATVGAGMYNALIASRPRTPHLEAAVKEFVRQSKKQGLITGMALNPILIGGAKREKLNQRLSQTVPPYLLSLEHYTEESDNTK